MRIGIDARAYDWTGIGRYVRNLLRHMTGKVAELPPPWPTTEFVVLVPARYAREVASLPRTRVRPVRNSYYSAYEQTGFLLEALGASVDLMHFPNFNAPILYRRPAIVTLHDMTRFSFSGQRHHGRLHQWAYAAVFRAAVRHAKRIIAVSYFTKDALLQRFPAARDKVSVVYEGVEQRFFASEAEKRQPALDLLRLGIHGPFLLYVGLWMRHKNLPGLMRTFRLAKATGYRGVLVITGEGRPWDEDVRALAVQEGVQDHVLLPGRVNDDTLAMLYRNADALLSPSFAEGFGLPQLEAMASRTPVVAARAGSLPEVLGGAALFAEPDAPEQMARALQTLFSDASVRTRLIGLGSARAAMFSWETCARQTLDVYAQALGVPSSTPKTKNAKRKATG